MDARRTPGPDLGHYRKLAKQLKRELDEGIPSAAPRFAKNHPKFVSRPAEDIRRARPTLADAQVVIARESGFADWAELKKAVEAAGDAKPRLWPTDRLFEAISAGDAATVESILRNDPALATRPNASGRLPLVEACDRGSLPIVELLLAAGADPRQGDADATPLLAAAHAGPHKPGPATAVIDRLLAAGVPDDLFMRAALGRVEALREALSRDGVDVNAKGPANSTPLFLAASNGHVGAVELLLERGADPAVPGRGGRTPWQSVLLHLWSPSHRQIAKLLIDRGAPASFLVACRLSHLPAVRRQLTENPALANQPDERGLTPLTIAVLNADAELARVLLSTGAEDPKGQGRALTDGTPRTRQDHGGAVFVNCSFRAANFHDVNLADATFSNVNLAGARLDNVNLSGARIDNASIRGLMIYGIDVEPILAKELKRRAAKREE